MEKTACTPGKGEKEQGNMAFMAEGSFTPFEKKIYLSSPTMHGEERQYMMEAYETNWMSTVGANIQEAERLAEEKLGVPCCVALSSGTAAMHLAVKLAGISQGDTVLASDMTFSATVNPIAYEGGRPVFVDAERDTWNMSPQALERAFTLYPQAKAVVLVNLYGTPAKLEELVSIAHRHGALVIEDAAESLGASYMGKQTGTFGDLGVISFNGNKIITGTCGGMLLTCSREQGDRARKWSTQSREAAPWYQHEERGYNYRMSNLVAGVVRGQFPHLEAHIEQKKRIYERYKAGFFDLPVTMNPFEGDKGTPNFWLSCILLNREAMCPQKRGKLTSAYTPQRGKSCPTEILEVLSRYNAEGRPLWKPMHLQPLYETCPFVTAHGDTGEDVGADLFERGLCLPSDNKMTEQEQDKIIELVRACFR